ncbi:putative SET domain protein [Cryptosporidium bovis]|uniref:putative SET domain protein n=1 Tax=Cryptosporidium bovis TaxID=310047 RepID=UPI00351A664A|nr:putative SET domain protein [Cryptosporidium bovis]
MGLQNTRDSIGNKSFICFSNTESRDEHEFLSKRIVEFGTGLIPLVNNTVKCTCEKTCDEFCLNRLNRYECNRSICGLYNNLHYVYCNNRPFQRLNEKKKIKFIAEKYRPRNEKEKSIRKFNLNVPRTSTRLILLEGISKGELIIECKGEILTNIDVRDRYSGYFGLNNNVDETQCCKEEIKNIPEKLFCLVDGYVYLDMTDKGNEARHIRHSCDPNSRAEVWISRPFNSSLKSGFRNEFSITWLKLGIFALKNLEKGTEITIDYENLVSRQIPGLKKKKNVFGYIGMLNCHCNSDICRKIIGTKEPPEEYELSSYLIPIPNKKERKKKYSRSDLTKGITPNKNSFESYIDIKDKLAGSQKKWREQHKKKQMESISHESSNIFEHDKNKIIEIQEGNFGIEAETGAPKYKIDIPLWYLYTIISWKGIPNIEKCCNSYLPHNNLYKQHYSRYNKTKNCSNLYPQRKSERLRRSCSKETHVYKVSKTNPKSNIGAIRFTGKRSIFLHLMTHPWYLALNSHTDVDFEFGKLWKSFLSRSIYLGRLFVIQRISIFFNVYKVNDEDLSWALIDQGIGDDEKCTVCSFHGTLLSCDICSRGVHKSCLNKSNQFISSPLFRLPDWFPMNDIKKKSYFNELVSLLYGKTNKNEFNFQHSPGNKIKCSKITVIYNPSMSTRNSHNTSIKSKDSETFICHICSNSYHSRFWISLSARKRKRISINAMKIRLARAFNTHFYGKQFSVNHFQAQKRATINETKKNNVKIRPQRNNQIRIAKIMINNLFVWRRNNSKFKIDQNMVFSELSTNYISRKEIDSRWNHRENNPSLKFPNPNIDHKNHSKFDQNIMTRESSNISVVKLEPLQILDSISFNEYIKINTLTTKYTP